jgi:hypothetical protein
MDHKEPESTIKNVKGRIMSNNKVNSFGVIDGARFQYYDEETKTVVIRVDHSEIPEFWMDIPIKLDQLQKWIGKAE